MRLVSLVLGTYSSVPCLLLQAFYVGIGRSHSEKLIYIHSGSAVTSETLYLDADEPTGTFKVVLPRTQDVEYG